MSGRETGRGRRAVRPEPPSRARPKTMPGVDFFIDISPLLEVSWTGISWVTARLVLYFLDRFPGRVMLYAGAKILHPEAVRTAITRAPGGYLGALDRENVVDLCPLMERRAQSAFSVGIFPNIKRYHRLFDVELCIFHDISPLLMPEVHYPGWGAVHTAAFLRDAASSDLIACVSRATEEDTLTYLPQARGKTFVAPLAPVIPPDVSLDAAAAPAVGLDPYVLILGTIEPRKNLKLVSRFLAAYPEDGARFHYVFVGREGWGPSFAETASEVLAAPEYRGFVHHLGYVSEATKFRLISAAQFVIYPSLFEGFGLPVLEALACGTPVIAARTSSLVEFGLREAFLFDPFSVTELREAFLAVTELAPSERTALAAELRAKAAEYSWDRFGDTLVARLAEKVAAAGAAGAPAARVAAAG